MVVEKLCPACNTVMKLVNCRVCTYIIPKLNPRDPTVHNECKRKRKGVSPWNTYVRSMYHTLDGNMKERMEQTRQATHIDPIEHENHIDPIEHE